MADNVAITPGSGATIRAKQLTGIDTQVVQLDVGGESAELLLVGDATYGIPADIKRFPATACIVNNPTAANLKVDASGATVPISAASAVPISAAAGGPAFVRLSNGTIAVDTIPVTGTVAATQSGSWSTILTDGTHNAHLSLVSAIYALDVNIVGSVALGGVSQADTSTFTAGATALTPIGGVYDDDIAAVTDGNAGAARITTNRGLHVNLRVAAGTEIGTAAAPLFVSPATSPNNQPVTGTITANQGTPTNWAMNVVQVGGGAVATAATGIAKVAIVDGSGAVWSETNPLIVTVTGKAKTRVTKSVAQTASQTASVLWTPAGGKTVYIKKIVLLVSVTGTCTFFDNTNAAANIIADGTWPTGVFVLDFVEPFASAAPDNVIKYTSGTGFIGVVTLHGFEE